MSWELMRDACNTGHPFALVRHADARPDVDAHSGTNPDGLVPPSAWQQCAGLGPAEVRRLARQFALAVALLDRMEAPAAVADAGPEKVAGTRTRTSGNPW